MILVENVQKAFGTVQALAGVSLQAPDGQITGLLGPNGAGKTTLLRILYTVLAPDSGHAIISGHDVRQAREQVQTAIGVLPHSHGLYSRLTPREHIRYYGQLRGMDSARLTSSIDELIELLDMQAIADRRCAGFSEGETVKVAMARALVHDPSTVLLDEPTAGLDVMAARKVRDLIRRLRDQGRCVLFSSHLMHEVAELCDRVVVIAGGRVAAAGTPDEIKQSTGSQSLEDAFVAVIGSGEGLMR